MGVAIRQCQTYERSKPVRVASLSWYELSVLFLEKFMTLNFIEELCHHFEQLHREGMSVSQYEMRFLELTRHTIWLVPIEKKRIRRFIDDVNYKLCFVVTRMHQVLGLMRWLILLDRQSQSVLRGIRRQRPRGSDGFSSVPSGTVLPQQGLSYRSAHMAYMVHHGSLATYSSYSARPGQSSLSALPAQNSSCALSVQGSFVYSEARISPYQQRGVALSAWSLGMY